MPPRKKRAAPLPPAPALRNTGTNTRATRASTRNKNAEAARALSPSPPPVAAAAAVNGKRKRAAAADSSDEMVKKKKKKKAPARRVQATSKLGPTETWFFKYADPHENSINGNTFQAWMDDLGVSGEGVFMYFILYKCNAQTQLSISKEEFVRTMNSFGIDSNAALLTKLPTMMAAVCPVANSDQNSEFRQFYKWCFQHFKVPGAKNLLVEVASVLLVTLLDAERYKPNWKPDGGNVRSCGVTPGDFPHLTAFVEFLNSEPKPVQVVTRDQYDQFYEFNLGVSWELDGYLEETSTWPTLFDNYVAWKNEKY